ncbi:MAG: YggT family protein [Gammaproteobacteria bacterium]|nr:YggT family protein [Gammaproteobacteria bacterium]
MTTLYFIYGTLIKVIVGLFLLRFLLQLTRADFYNPVSLAVVKFTNPLVMPLRRIIPGLRGMDLASLGAAFLVQVAAFVLIDGWFFRGQLPGLLASSIGAIISLLNVLLSLYFMLILLRVLMSWLNPDPRNPMVSVLYSLTEPVMAPARRLLPPIGGLDLSPIVVLFAISILQVFLNSELVPWIARL